MMRVIIKDITDINNEKKHIRLLNQMIKEDIKRNDTKSLKYHTLALQYHRNSLKKLNERIK